MVQYKKEDIKEKIDNAALKIFVEKGYEKAKISNIATESNVSVGNIYRYYKSKEEIFYSIAPESVLENLKSILINKLTFAKDKTLSELNSKNDFQLVNEEFIDYMIKNRDQILIMFIGSKGTRYESLKDEAINYMIKIIKENYSKENNKIIYDSMNYRIIKIIYKNFIEMIMQILKESNSSEDIKKSFKIINLYHLFGVTNLFK
ncbi:TetR/AcrR family transcriptional regulator [Clostridium sp. P21]|uniref:TetR/AcrR family transcriptional regulator n=1 Tax=Clostridium muellerianum TaxID=2716538 RepID=A0A7Y0HNL3_9CLOT|nr:TetR/AcrR family transcriptional regulator [Clostridium muellerianum]NMM63270.1 TetR/AcrR family transcriptional regulator [Clostridium muellerianum]